MAADDFLSTYAPLANDIATQTGMDPSVVLGVIDTETGHGQHVLGNNIFGISPGGKVASYPDVNTGANAFVSLMQTPRYAGVASGASPAEQAAALVKGGYNTANPNYAQMVAGKATAFGKQLGYQNPTTAPTESPISQLKREFGDTSQPPGPLTGPPVKGSTSATAPAQPVAPDSPIGQLQREFSDTSQPPGRLTGPPVSLPGAPLPWPTSFDEAGRPITDTPPGITGPVPGQDVANRILGAGVEGWKSTPPVLTPLGEQTVSKYLGPVGDYLVNPALRLGGDILAGANALTTGGMQGINEATAAAGAPGLGRDINMLLQVAPAAKMFGPAGVTLPVEEPPPSLGQSPPRVGAPGGEPAPAPNYAPGVAPLSAEAQARGQANPLGPTSEVPPPPPGGAPQPQPVGAAASPSGVIGLTPQEETAYRSTAEGQKWLERQEPGVPDRNAYIPGVTPNLAEQEQTVAMARELKALGFASEEASQEAKDAAFRNNEKRLEYLLNTVQSPVDILREETAQQADIERQKPAVFANSGEPDLQPIGQKIDDILNLPENRQNDPVQAAIAPLRARLFDEDGNPKITDPRELWGFRQQLDRMTSPRMQAADPNLHYAAHNLQDIADVVDQQIQAVAPGYQEMLDTYRQHADNIREMEVLQGHEKGLVDSQNRMQYAPFQRMMKNVVDMRAAGPGVNPYKSISDETMARLWNLRDDLRRSSGALELARAPGSDSVPNALDVAKQYAKVGGTAAVHGIANLIAPGVGSMAVRGVSHATAPFRAARIKRFQQRRAQELLNPSNPLIQPPPEYNPLTTPPP